METSGLQSTVEVFSRCSERHYFSGAWCPFDGYTSPHTIELAAAVGLAKQRGAHVSFAALQLDGVSWPAIANAIAVEFPQQVPAFEAISLQRDFYHDYYRAEVGLQKGLFAAAARSALRTIRRAYCRCDWGHYTPGLYCTEDGASSAALRQFGRVLDRLIVERGLPTLDDGSITLRGLAALGLQEPALSRTIVVEFGHEFNVFGAIVPDTVAVGGRILPWTPTA